MQAEVQAHLAFHLTGKMPAGALDAVAASGLRPALLAGYRDLTTLRYDFPLVLVGGGTQANAVQSLSGMFDSALKEVASGVDGDRLSKHARRLEREIRKLVAEGATGSLSALWGAAAARLGAKNDELLRDSLGRLHAALKPEGEVTDCDRTMPFRFVKHAWQLAQDQKAKKFRNAVDKLIVKLSDILSADFGRSKEALSAERLKASVGAGHRDAFDFDAMSRLLAERSPTMPLRGGRGRRIRELLSVLQSQRFFPPGDENEKRIGGAEPYSFVFENCADAIAAYRERLPKVTALAKAIAMAELETEGEYSEPRHDAFFAEFGDNGLGASDADWLPDYLICLHSAEIRGADSDLILQAWAAGLPAKVLVQTDDLLEPSPIGDGFLMAGLRSKQLTSTAIGLGTHYVLQSSSANMFQQREQIFRGLAYPGPALFSIYSGAMANGIPTYLVAAAATESRVFPAFTYDPSAGPNWASRFSLLLNPQPELDWPIQRLDYEDAAHRKISETLAFTLADFAACDQRYAKHFAKVPSADWNGNMLPVAEFLTREAKDLSEKVPYLLAVDGDNRLQKMIVDDKVIGEARRCVEMWHSLQELGGIHNSHAEKRLEQERTVWAEPSPPPAVVEQSRPPAAIVVPDLSPAAPVPDDAPKPAAERDPDAPYIETERCISCDECTQINNVMFGYDANKQASIVNPDAGTYRQLVEAAESCQVSIIHPGKPRNPDEPDLDELQARAELFS
jgi:ferredoxin